MCIVWSFEPFKTRPVFGFLFVSTPLLVCLVCSSTPCFFFSVRRSGNPNLELFFFATEGGVEEWVFGHYFLAIP